MTLVTKLKVFGVFASILILLLGIEVYWNFHQVGLALERDKIANEVVKEAFILNILTGDYIETHGDRAEVQWRSQLQHLNKSISNYKIESEEEQSIINQLVQEQQTTLTHFLQYRNSIKEREKTAFNTLNQSFIQELEKRLNSQLSIDTQRIVSLASALSDMNAQRVIDIGHSSIIFFIITTLCLGLLLIVIYILLANSISKAMEKLIEGIEILGRGNLDFRFDNKNQDEFGQLANSFDEMVSRLKKLDAAKSEFVLLASHQLRTPLSIINWYAESLLSESKGKLNPDQKKYLIQLYEGSKRMSNLANSLLTVSRLELGTFTTKPEPLDIVEIANLCIKEFQEQIEEKKITFTKTIQLNIPKIPIDKALVTSVFENLLSNSVLYTPTDGKILLHIAKEDEKIRISVEDTGIGIPKNQQSQIFTKFFRADNAKKVYVDGAGLGLYVIKSILTISRGSIWFTSEEGKSTTFYVMLPIN